MRYWVFGFIVSFMSLDIRELAQLQGIGFRIMEDDGILGLF